MKAIILSYVKINGPVKLRNISQYLTNGGHKISQREIRLIIVSMQQDDGHLIISSRSGYKLCENIAEYEKAISYLNSYIFSLLKRRRAMKQNFQRLVKPQLFEQ